MGNSLTEVDFSEGAAPDLPAELELAADDAVHAQTARESAGDFSKAWGLRRRRVAPVAWGRRSCGGWRGVEWSRGRRRSEAWRVAAVRGELLSSSCVFSNHQTFACEAEVAWRGARSVSACVWPRIL